jgi:hypothetical protein
MLFRHHSRGISFTLVVDDFGVKYTSLDDFHHLQTSLELLYLVTCYLLPDWHSVLRF